MTPNVRLGNRLTMNSDTFHFSQKDAKTFAHEMGHVLGFPDCYVEFYDAKKKVMVFYSLDPSNIMCTLAGDVKKLHFRELEKHIDKTPISPQNHVNFYTLVDKAKPLN